MKSLKELSAQLILGVLSEDTKEILFESYIKNLYLPNLNIIEDIFEEHVYNFNKINDDKISHESMKHDFDLILKDFCETFPELITHGNGIILIPELNVDKYYKKDRKTHSIYFRNRRINHNSNEQDYILPQEKEDIVFSIKLPENGINYRTQNNLIDFFISKNMPIWPGINGARKM